MGGGKKTAITIIRLCVPIAAARAVTLRMVVASSITLRTTAPTAEQEWTVMKMYESPISIQKMVEHNIRESIDGAIYEAVLKTDVHVDKDELIRALRYDRDQYAKGYADGKRDAEQHGQWTCDEDDGFNNFDWHCTECGRSIGYRCGNPVFSAYCPHCGAKMDEEGSDD